MTTTATINDLNQITALSGGTTATLTFDSNGNMTSDGTNSYSYAAENRLVKITYPGAGNNSQMSYDAFGNVVKIVETVSSSVTSTKQFVNSGSSVLEERNAGSTITKQFFAWGQTLSGSNYYYTRDHLGSVRDMTDSSGSVQAHYEYDPFGQVTASGTLASAFQYAGYYLHAPSGLNITLNRAFNSSLGRWINRDPIEEHGGVNLYGYVRNIPTGKTDPSGLDAPYMGTDQNGNVTVDVPRPDTGTIGTEIFNGLNTAGGAIGGAIDTGLNLIPFWPPIRRDMEINMPFWPFPHGSCPVKKKPLGPDHAPPHTWPGTHPWDPPNLAPRETPPGQAPA